MFLDYFQLRQQPFGAALSPAYVYPSAAFTEALLSMRNSLFADRGSFAFIGDPGSGKSLILSQLFEDMQQSGRITFRFGGSCEPRDVLGSVLSGLGVDPGSMDLATMQRRLNQMWFVEMLAGKRFVLLFDDAQDLAKSVLATLQQLARFETPKSRLIQMVLGGRPALLHRLQSEDLASLRRHLVHTQHLDLLSPMETAGYIRQRFSAAGHGGNSLLDPEAMALVAQFSSGIPQEINKLCSRALFEAYARGLQSVTAEQVEMAARSLAQSASPHKEKDRSLVTETPESVAGPSAALTSQLTYMAAKPARLPGSGLWVGAVLGVLLSAGLALPHANFRGVSQFLHSSNLPTTASGGITHAAKELAMPTSPMAATSHTPDASLSPARKGPMDTSDSSASQSSLTRELGLKISRIVIDPGHGGFDTGARGPQGLLEKDLCLDVALRLGQMIQANIPGAQVVYTRRDDSYVPLEERTAIANGAGADLFISIHANSSSVAEVRGVETFYLSLAASNESRQLAIRENALTQSGLHDLPDIVKKITNNEKITESRVLAAHIQDALSQRLQLVSRREKNRGVKPAPFIVLTGANMPAVLSEISFVSNASDEALLSQNVQRERIAEGLYRGISSYLDGLANAPQSRQKLLTENHSEAAAPLVQTADPNHRPL